MMHLDGWGSGDQLAPLCQLRLVDAQTRPGFSRQMKQAVNQLQEIFEYRISGRRSMTDPRVTG